MNRGFAAIAIFAVVACFGVVHANDAFAPIYKTNQPNTSLGFDISSSQTIGIRFRPKETAALQYIELWFMNNSNAATPVTLSLNEDHIRADGLSEPSDIVLEEWTFQISSAGWGAEKEQIRSLLSPILESKQRYWLIAQSNAPATKNPVWNVAGSQGEDNAVAYYGRLVPGIDIWEVGYSAIPSVRVYGDVVQ
jgi:hypothetical protein